jgi:hypothetical protein
VTVSDAPADPVLDVAGIVEVLNRHRVAYVVIGGVAGGAWAASVDVVVQPTTDIDITPANSRANLDRLSAALHDLDARIRTEDVPGGLAFDHDGPALARGQIWNLICRHGPLDISMQPAGTDGYADLAERARVVDVEGLAVPIADLADIVRSKRAANRPEEALRRREARRGRS